MIALSDQYLDEQARQALRALSVFPAKPNTFSEEAALAVSAVPVEVLDTLSDTGLLEVDEAGRYAMHRAIADYARLEYNAEKAFEHLLIYYVSYLETPSVQAETEALEEECNNIYKALEVAYKMGKGDAFVRMICAFTPFLILRGLYAQAEHHLMHALEFSLESIEKKVQVLLLLGQTAQKQGRYPQAVEYFQQGLELARPLNKPEWISALLADLGWVTWKQGNYTQAEAYLQEGLIVAQQIGNDERICKFFRLFGAVLSARGFYRESVEYSQKGLKLARQIGNREHICVLLIDLGTGFLENDDFAQAETYLQEGLALAQQIGHHEWTSLTFVNLSDLAILQQRYVEAKKHIEQGLPLARQIGSYEWEFCHLLNLGICNRELGDYNEANTAFRDAIVLAQQLGRRFFMFMSWYEYSDLFIKRGQAEMAEAQLRKCDTVIPPEDRDLKGLWLFGMARLAKLQGNVEQALRLAEESKATFVEAGNYRTRSVEQWLAAIRKDELPSR